MGRLTSKRHAQNCRGAVRAWRSWPLAAAALFLPLSSQAVAQTAPDPPVVISPLKIEPERNGVNLTTGKIDLDVPSLGVPGAPRLHFDKVQNSAPYMRGTISGAEFALASYSVTTTGGSSESFRCTDWDCSSAPPNGSITQSGSTFVATGIHHQNASYRRAGSGEVYHFTRVSADSLAGSIRTVQAYASSISYADGEVVTFTYDSTVCGGGTCYRPNKIETNVGYFITVDYQCSDITQNCWSAPFHAKLFAASAPGTPIQSLTYSGSTVTDIGGRVWNIVGSGNALGSPIEVSGGTIQLPTEASNAVTISVAGNVPLVGSFVRDGVTWTYAYTNPQPNPGNAGSYTYTNLTVTGPNGYSMSYAIGQVGSGPGGGYTQIINAATDALNRQTSYQYDGGMRPTRLTLPEGNYAQIGYDNCGNITTKTSVAKVGSGLANIVESAVYPSDATCLGSGVLQYRLTSYTDARSKVTNYTWNSDGQLTQQDDPANAAGVRRRTINDYTVTGTLSRKTMVRVCAAGATPLTCSGASLSQTEYTYFGNTFLPATVKLTDNNNCAPTCITETTTYTYDPWGNVTSIQGPMNGVSGTKYFQYDNLGRKVWEVGAADGGNVRLAKNFHYRPADDKVDWVKTGLLTCPSDCKTDALAFTTLLEQTDTTYDSRRYPIRELTSSGGTAWRISDRSFLDRALADCTTVRMNFASAPFPTSTSACTLGTTGSSGPDRITKNVYDNAGQLLKIQKAYLITTANGFPQTLQQDYVTYAYTLNGKQQFVTDANGNKAQFTWDGFDRLSKWNFPSPTTPGTVSSTDYEQYGYDAAGNRLSLRRRDGRTLTFTYDNLNRMLSKLIPDGCPPIQPPGTGCPASTATRDVFTSYDILGRQLTAKFDSTGGADGITNAYDGFGNVTSSTVSMGGFSKTVTSLYDLDNNRTRATHPDSQAFTYSYDARDRLSGVYEGIGTGTALDGFVFNADDTLATRLDGAGGGGSAGYSYDPIGRLTGQSDAFPAAPTSNVQWNFQITSASQILSETRDNDAFAFTGIASANKAYAINGLNQYTAVAGSTLLYDANGNVTSDPAAGAGGTTYIYDGENRLVSATAAGQTTTLTYDPLGRLWQVVKGTANTRFLYDGDALIGEFDGAGALTNRYVHGSNITADDPLLWYVGAGTATKRYLHADHLGSIVAATNSSGAPTINSYDEYGIPGSANVGRFQYTGQIWLSELGLYHYKARLYSPYLGRFLQTDPIGYEGGSNLYDYVVDDPVNTSDWSGNCPDACVAEGAGLGIVYGVVTLGVATGVCVKVCDKIATGIRDVVSSVFSRSRHGPLSNTVPLTWSVARTTGESQRQGSIHVYRVYGGIATEFGMSWTPIDPRAMQNPRAQLGLPAANTASRLVEGDLYDLRGVGFRPSRRIGDQPGGAPEFVIPNNEIKVKNRTYSSFKSNDRGTSPPQACGVATRCYSGGGVEIIP
jgi:RHS repeat-associated protein